MPCYFLQFCFAMSPLIILFAVIYLGFETKEEEDARRNKKEDFVIPSMSD